MTLSFPGFRASCLTPSGLAVTLVYTWLDVRAADWSLGTGLYRGKGSLAPVVVGVLALLLWLRLHLIAAHESSAGVTTSA